MNNLNENLFVGDYNKNVSILTTLLKKFQFIDTLEIDFCLDKLLDTITESCNHLTSMRFNVYDMESEAFKKFCRKFGQQLRHISFNGFGVSQRAMNILFENCRNVSSISNISVQYLSSELILEKLVKLEKIFLVDNELSNSLFDKLSKLKYLSIDSVREQDYSSIEVLSKYLKNLKVFKITVSYRSSIKMNIWSKTIESIATNCRQLEYFSFILIYSEMYGKQLFQRLVHFSGLKKLSYVIRANSICQINEWITDLTPLKNCKNLFNLNLELSAINSNVFNGIELIVPQLRQLCLKCPNLEITDEVLESMAKLKYLTDIEIMGKRNTMRADGLRVLINGCKRLRHFAVSYDFTNNPNHKKINEMVVKHPNIHFEFH